MKSIISDELDCVCTHSSLSRAWKTSWQQARLDSRAAKRTFLSAVRWRHARDISRLLRHTTHAVCVHVSHVISVQVGWFAARLSLARCGLIWALSNSSHFHSLARPKRVCSLCAPPTNVIKMFLLEEREKTNPRWCLHVVERDLLCARAPSSVHAYVKKLAKPK